MTSRDLLTHFLAFINGGDCYYNTQVQTYSGRSGLELIDYYLLYGRKVDCNSCQGNGCPVCGGFGYISQSLGIDESMEIPPDGEMFYRQQTYMELQHIDRQMVEELSKHPRIGMHKTTLKEATDVWNKTAWHRIIARRMEELKS